MSASPNQTQPLSGRAAAIVALVPALDGRKFASEILRELRGSGQLDGREAALATEIAQGTIRHLVTIEHILAAVATYEPRRVSLRLRAILASATYQIVWMDRVPVFAAVDEAVNLARRQVRGRSPAMVNAVLRRLGRAIRQRVGPWERLNPEHIRTGWDRACVFDFPVLPPAANDLEAYLAAATGEREQRFRRLCERLGPESAELVAWASQAVPVTVVQRHALRATTGAFEQSLRVSFGNEIDFAHGAAFLLPAAAIKDAPAFQDGLIYVQDLTAHAAALAVDAQPDERILDLCAAPGGKTVTLANSMQNRGHIVAVDVSAPRLALLDASVARLGLSCVRTRLITPDAPDPAGAGPPCDAALVDVPCSNTGVIARRPEARRGLAPAKLRTLIAMQRELLRRAARCLRPAGASSTARAASNPKRTSRLSRILSAKTPGGASPNSSQRCPPGTLSPPPGAMAATMPESCIAVPTPAIWLNHTAVEHPCVLRRTTACLHFCGTGKPSVCRPHQSP